MQREFSLVAVGCFSERSSTVEDRVAAVLTRSTRVVVLVTAFYAHPYDSSWHCYFDSMPRQFILSPARRPGLTPQLITDRRTGRRSPRYTPAVASSAAATRTAPLSSSRTAFRARGSSFRWIDEARVSLIQQPTEDVVVCLAACLSPTESIADLFRAWHVRLSHI